MSVSGNPGPPGNTQLCHGSRGAQTWRSRSRILCFVAGWDILIILSLCDVIMWSGQCHGWCQRVLGDKTWPWHCNVNNCKFDTLTFPTNNLASRIQQQSGSEYASFDFTQMLWSLECGWELRNHDLIIKYKAIILIMKTEMCWCGKLRQNLNLQLLWELSNVWQFLTIVFMTSTQWRFFLSRHWI